MEEPKAPKQIPVWDSHLEIIADEVLFQIKHSGLISANTEKVILLLKEYLQHDRPASDHQ